MNKPRSSVHRYRRPHHPYQWKKDHFSPGTGAPVVYESHVGLATGGTPGGNLHRVSDRIVPYVRDAWVQHPPVNGHPGTPLITVPLDTTCPISLPCPHGLAPRTNLNRLWTQHIRPA
jgi:hypothetical protein